MSSGITATNLAGMGYSNYTFANSANGKKHSISEADIAKNDYGVSNLSNALNSLDFSSDMDGMTTVDNYAKAHYLASQTTAFNSTSNNVDFSTLTGTMSSYAKTAYAAAKKGLTSSPVSLYSVTTAASTANSDYTYSLLSSSLSSGSTALSAYRNYLGTSTYYPGSLLSTVA